MAVVKIWLHEGRLARRGALEGSDGRGVWGIASRCGPARQGEPVERIRGGEKGRCTSWVGT